MEWQVEELFNWIQYCSAATVWSCTSAVQLFQSIGQTQYELRHSQRDHRMQSCLHRTSSARLPATRKRGAHAGNTIPLNNKNFKLQLRAETLSLVHSRWKTEVVQAERYFSVKIMNLSYHWIQWPRLDKLRHVLSMTARTDTLLHLYAWSWQ